MNNLILIPPRLREQAERYCKLMLEVSGADPMEESRRRPVVMARMMVANALLIDGYSLTAVGTILGVDHSSVSHYKDRMSVVLGAPGYEAEREVWGRFVKEILNV